jgi:hypothetical protein
LPPLLDGIDALAQFRKSSVAQEPRLGQRHSGVRADPVIVGAAIAGVPHYPVLCGRIFVVEIKVTAICKKTGRGDGSTKPVGQPVANPRVNRFVTDLRLECGALGNEIGYLNVQLGNRWVTIAELDRTIGLVLAMPLARTYSLALSG